MVSCSRFILDHKINGLVGFVNYIVCKRFAVQILLWSLEFVIQINLKQKLFSKATSSTYKYIFSIT